MTEMNTNPLEPFEINQVTSEYQTDSDLIRNYEESDNGKDLLFAGLALESLAMTESDRVVASNYMGRAIISFEKLIGQTSPVNYPLAEQIEAQAHLSVMPLMLDLTIDKRLSPLEKVEAVYKDYRRDLSKQAYLARAVADTPAKNGDELEKKRRGEIVGTLNGLAVLGMLMRHQVRDIRSSDWMAMPVHAKPSMLNEDDGNATISIHNANIYVQYDEQAPELAYKVYVRTAAFSDHNETIDEDTSVVWLATDLKVPGERYTTASTIIKELSAPKGKDFKLDLRTKKLTQIIDVRTLGDLRKPVDNQ